MALSLLVGACSSQEPPPRTTWERFFTSMILYQQEGAPEYQREAFELLSEECQSALAARAGQLNRSLPAGAHLMPWQLLVTTGAAHELRATEVEEISSTPDTSTLRVQFGAATEEIQLIREVGKWRVALAPDALVPQIGGK